MAGRRQHATTYWGVDVRSTPHWRTWCALGCACNSVYISEVGGGIRMADVESPTGDAFGLIENPNFVAAAPPAIYGRPRPVIPARSEFARLR